MFLKIGKIYNKLNHKSQKYKKFDYYYNLGILLLILYYYYYLHRYHHLKDSLMSETSALMFAGLLLFLFFFSSSSLWRTSFVVVGRSAYFFSSKISGFLGLMRSSLLIFGILDGDGHSSSESTSSWILSNLIWYRLNQVLFDFSSSGTSAFLTSGTYTFLRFLLRGALSRLRSVPLFGRIIYLSIGYL